MKLHKLRYESRKETLVNNYVCRVTKTLVTELSMMYTKFLTKIKKHLLTLLVILRRLLLTKSNIKRNYYYFNIDLFYNKLFNKFILTTTNKRNHSLDISPPVTLCFLLYEKLAYSLRVQVTLLT